MKDDLDKRWKATNDALDELANLHTRPVDKDVADAEGELLEELEEIEYEAGRAFSRTVCCRNNSPEFT